MYFNCIFNIYYYYYTYTNIPHYSMRIYKHVKIYLNKQSICYYNMQALIPILIFRLKFI